MKYIIKGILIAVLASNVMAKCGPGYGSCSGSQCCSKYGYCGTTSDYCGTGCQVGYGLCDSSSKVSTNGRCGSEYGSCPSGQCCSKYGYCGTTSEYCSTGCQSSYGQCESALPVSTNGRCGPSYGTVCPSGKCCSKYGYCGTSSEYCSTGCQSSYGICSTSATTATAKTTTTTTKTKTTTTATTNSSLPTSTNGLCGPNNGICPNHQCCSKYGYCGSSDDYCTAASGCQSEFGRCGEYVSNLKFKYYYECKNSKHWALSYDDGPYNYDLDLLDLLKKKGVKATFFLNGANVMDITSSKGRAIVKRMYEDGHVIGSHTWSHANLEELSASQIKSEMTLLEDALQDIIGKKPALMRPPYGAGDGSDEIATILNDLGYTAACMWNVDTLDWDTTGDVDYALKIFKKYLGKPILSLNHCFYQGITRETLLTLAEAEIDYMLGQGYTPVTMDVCLGLDAYQN